MNITDSLAYKNLPLVAATGLAAFSKIGAVAAPIIIAPIAINMTITELTLSRMSAFKLTPNQISLILTFQILAAFATTIAAFVILPTPLAIIFGISSFIVLVNNYNKIDSELESYESHFKKIVEEKDLELRKDIESAVIDADDKTRQDNEALFTRLNKYLKTSRHLPTEFEELKSRSEDIDSIAKEMRKLSTPA